MQFLQQRPDVLLADPALHRYNTFAADMFAGRPAFEEMLGFKDWSETLQASLKELLDRKACPVKTITILVDQTGALVLVTTKKPAGVGEARSAVDTLLKQAKTKKATGTGETRTEAETLPVAQRTSVTSSIHVFDELDKVRVDAWVTAWLPRPPPPPPPALRDGITIQEFLDQQAESDDEEPPRLLALTDVGDTGLGGIDETLWRESVTCRAVVVLAHAGPAWALVYIRCHREPRRVDLLAGRLTRKASLVDCARIALRMASEGSLPGHLGPRARKTEFLRRCTEALVKVNPGAICDPKSLAPRQAWELDALLGAVAARPCDRCGIPVKRPTSIESMIIPTELEDFRQTHRSVRDKVYCHGCANVARVVYCPVCGKDDEVAPTPELTPFEKTYGVRRHRCNRCDTPATATRAKRSWSEANRDMAATDRFMGLHE